MIYYCSFLSHVFHRKSFSKHPKPCIKQQSTTSTSLASLTKTSRPPNTLRKSKCSCPKVGHLLLAVVTLFLVRNQQTKDNDISKNKTKQLMTTINKITGLISVLNNYSLREILTYRINHFVHNQPWISVCFHGSYMDCKRRYSSFGKYWINLKVINL